MRLDFFAQKLLLILSYFYSDQVSWLEELFNLNKIDVRKFLLLMHNFLDTKDLCLGKEAKKRREIEESMSEYSRKKFCLWIEGPR